MTVVSLASLKCKYWLQSSGVSCEANIGQRSIEAVTVNEGSQDEVHVQLYTIHTCELNCITRYNIDMAFHIQISFNDEFMIFFRNFNSETFGPPLKMPTVFCHKHLETIQPNTKAGFGCATYGGLQCSAVVKLDICVRLVVGS